MSDEKIFETLPEITEETRRRVELQFNHYIWYEGNGARGKREYVCSCCHAEWRQDKLREVTPEDTVLYSADHGEEVICPRCGETAKLMSLGKCRSGWRYSQAFGISVLAAASEDEVWIRTYRVAMNYGSYYSRGTGIYAKMRPSWVEVSRHRIVPGGAEYWCAGWYSKELEKCDKLYDFFNNRTGRMYGRGTVQTPSSFRHSWRRHSCGTAHGRSTTASGRQALRCTYVPMRCGRRSRWR